jgi:hypothetical protein
MIPSCRAPTPSSNARLKYHPALSACLSIDFAALFNETQLIDPNSVLDRLVAEILEQ